MVLPQPALTCEPATWILDAATEELSRLEVVESSITLPSLETLLAAAEG